jgi:RNA polymerase sigma-70 factor (ECF subfamily)
MAAPEQDDQNLIRAYLAGDHASFDPLYERYRRPLYSYLNRMLPNQAATVDDLFQQAWTKALANLARYQHQQSFYAWLVRIAHNAAIDHFRRQRHTAPLDLDELDPPHHGPAPWHQLTDQEFAAALQDAIANLPADQREVLLLRRDGVPFKEIATIQRATLNTVLGRMHYAVQKLRQALVEHRPD